MGEGGVGKSSTVNSIIRERVVSVSPFQAEGPRPVMVSRSRAGFTLNIIDTPGLIEVGYINDLALDIIKRKSEGSGKACLTKPPVDNAIENIEECQEKKNCSSLVSPHADSVVEIGIVEVEYIESENLKDLEHVDTTLNTLGVSFFSFWLFTFDY